MANIPAQLYRGDSDYLDTISNVDGQILFDSDKKEIFVDDGTTRESYGGGAGDKTYATLAQAQADIANISEKDTVFVKEGTSGSLTQRVDDLEDEVEQINSDLSELSGWEDVTSSIINTANVQNLKAFKCGKVLWLFFSSSTLGNGATCVTLPSSLTPLTDQYTGSVICNNVSNQDLGAKMSVTKNTRTVSCVNNFGSVMYNVNATAFILLE
jgi:hypothetical protein